MAAIRSVRTSQLSDRCEGRKPRGLDAAARRTGSAVDGDRAFTARRRKTRALEDFSASREVPRPAPASQKKGRHACQTLLLKSRSNLRAEGRSLHVARLLAHDRVPRDAFPWRVPRSACLVVRLPLPPAGAGWGRNVGTWLRQRDLGQPLENAESLESGGCAPLRRPAPPRPRTGRGSDPWQPVLLEYRSGLAPAQDPGDLNPGAIS